MSEIFFYHLQRSSVENTLPSLVRRSLQRQWRVMVFCPTDTIRDGLDRLLWTFSETVFLAHGTDKDAFPQEQPVLLSCNERNINQADVCFSVHGAIASNPQDYTRLCILFDGHNPEHLSATRTAWKKWKSDIQGGQATHLLTHWQQNEKGLWEKNA